MPACIPAAIEPSCPDGLDVTILVLVARREELTGDGAGSTKAYRAKTSSDQNGGQDRAGRYASHHHHGSQD